MSVSGAFMQVSRFTWRSGCGWDLPRAAGAAGLVLYFGSRALLEDGRLHHELLARCPDALVAGCSTGGHGFGPDIGDDALVGVALGFRSTTLRLATAEGVTSGTSFDDGQRMGRALAGPGLAGILLLSDGLNVNGSALVTGLSAAIGRAVPVFGGMAGDGPDFRRTLIGAGAVPPGPQRAAAIGLYGPHLRLGHGSAGGWHRFGPQRLITAADGNVLHMLDHAPALDLYERYLGEEAAGLPGTGLLFPLRIWDPARPDRDVVRTVLGVDRAARTLTFGAEIPQGWRAQLMRGGIDWLADGAAEAARAAREGCTDATATDSLGLLVSCIGRRLLMGQRVGEEIEAATAQFPDRLPIVVFYSYGEVSPRDGSGEIELHNQTMTVTMLHEAA